MPSFTSTYTPPTTTASTSSNSTASNATQQAIANGQAVNSQLAGYSDSITNIGNTIKSESAGQVPDDVIATLKQQGAEGNVATGAASNAAYLHALGLTSLGLQDTAVKNLESVTASLPGASISQNSQYYQTQQQAYESQLQQQEYQREDQQQEAALETAKASSQKDVYTTDSQGNIRKNGKFFSKGTTYY